MRKNLKTANRIRITDNEKVLPMVGKYRYVRRVPVMNKDTSVKDKDTKD